MRITGFFTDAKRRKIREKTRVGVIEDYFLRSEVSDYRNLRVVVNTVLGTGFAVGLYYLGWQKLNFADFHEIFGPIFQTFMIASIVLVFALSPMFRVAMFCVFLGAMGKNGQAPLTMLVFDNLQEGPISNIVNNYQKTAEIVVCHLELQAKVAANRVSLFTGPLEELLQKQMTKGVQVLRKATKFVRNLIAPFLSDLSDKKTKEDARVDEREQQLTLIERRKAIEADRKESDMLKNEDEATVKKLEELSHHKPDWTNFKTEYGRTIMSRVSHRCNDIFSNGVDRCRDMFTSMKDKCDSSLPIGVNWMVCNHMNMQESCQTLERRQESLSICEKHMREAKLNNGIEKEVGDVVNMTKQIEEEMKISLHTVAVEMPRQEAVLRIQDIKIRIKAGATYVKAMLLSTKHVIQGLFIFFIYQIFRDAVRMINNYLTDVEFNNRFITDVFWKVDQYRVQHDQMALLRLNKAEMREWNLMKVFSWPTRVEVNAAKRPFYNWLVLTIVVITLIIIDFYLYSFLSEITKSSQTHLEQVGQASAEIEVVGEGVVADFVNNMIKINRTVEVDESLSNEHCLVPPEKPDIAHLVKWLLLPLVLALFMQVLFSFIVKRVIINYFLPFMFPRRDRVRLIYLYNKLLYARSKHRTEARSRIRFTVDRWTINDVHDEGGWLSSRSWFKLQILDRVFKTGQCLMCQIHMRPASLYFCPHCPATYCKYCLEEMENECYACQAEEGLVSSERSQVRVPGITNTTTATTISTPSTNFMRHKDRAMA